MKPTFAQHLAQKRAAGGDDYSHPDAKRARGDDRRHPVVPRGGAAGVAHSPLVPMRAHGQHAPYQTAPYGGQFFAQGSPAFPHPMGKGGSPGASPRVPLVPRAAMRAQSAPVAHRYSRGPATLDAVVNSFRPTPAYDEAVQEVLDEFLKFLTRVYHNPACTNLILFGSLLQNSYLEGSDLDISLAFGDLDLSANREACGMLRQLQTAINSDRRSGFSVKEARLSATIRVPIICIYYTPQSRRLPQLELDISVGAVTASDGTRKGFTDEMIGAFLKEDGPFPLAADVIRLVKIFAKQHVMNEAFTGFFNSLSWTVVAIFALQRCGLLPTWSDWDTFKPARDAQSKDLLTCFQAVLSTICDLDTLRMQVSPEERLCVSLVTGSTMPVPLHIGGVEPRTTIVVEDPGARIETDSLNNCARSLKPHCWASMCGRCFSAMQALQAGDLASIFPRPPSGGWRA